MQKPQQATGFARHGGPVPKPPRASSNANLKPESHRLNPKPQTKPSTLLEEKPGRRQSSGRLQQSGEPSGAEKRLALPRIGSRAPPPGLSASKQSAGTTGRFSGQVWRDTHLSAARRKPQPLLSSVVRELPRSSLQKIFEYVCSSPRDLLTMLLVCRDWHVSLADSKLTWLVLKQAAGRQNKYLRQLDPDRMEGEAMKRVVREGVVMDKLERVNVLMKKVDEMFKYNSMKMNVPNKIVEWLNIELDLSIHKNISIQGHKFHYNKMNYASFFFTEVKKVNKLRFAEFDSLKITFHFRSSRLEETVQIPFIIDKREILESCKKTRLFNYYLNKNLALVYFDGDDSILKCLFEISAVHLILSFVSLFQKNKTVLKAVLPQQKAKKFETSHEKFASALSYDSIADYLKEQTHFEVSVSIHNGKERVFYFVNTTSRPSSFSMAKGAGSKAGKQLENRANQGVRFLFERLGEPLENEDVYLKLNNELGISEKIEDLIFCEVMVKDGEKVRFIDSGLRVFNRQESSEEVDFAVHSKMILRAEEAGQFAYRFEVHNDGYSLLLQTVDITLGANYFL